MGPQGRKMRIVINGVEYDDPSKVPAEYRRLLEDKDGDGIPDHIQDQIQKGGPPVQAVINTRIVINGREYASWDEVPDEFRRFVADRDGDGVPEVVRRTGVSLRLTSSAAKGALPALQGDAKPEARSEDRPPDASLPFRLLVILLAAGVLAAAAVALHVAGLF